MASETREITPSMFWRAVSHLSTMIEEKNLGLIAAGVAFYAILAVFPGIAATIALWGIVGEPAQVLEEMARFEALIPDQVYALIAGQLIKLATTDGLTLGWASLLSFGFALYTAQNGVSALMQGLNTIYGVPSRPGIWHYVRSFVLTLCLIAVALVAILCVVVAPIALAFVPLGSLAGTAVEIARWVLVMIVLLAGFGVIYRLGPNTSGHKPRLITPGSVFAAVFWAIASFGFSFYLANFGRYNEIYGSIGAVIAMLMWLYISAWLVLLGGALNARLEQRIRRAREARTTP